MQNKTILGLSMTQPWATLVTLSAKRVETRSWGTPYRGWIAIQAAKTFPGDAKLLCREKPFNKYIGTISELPLGTIIALARVEVVNSTPYQRMVLETQQCESARDELAFGDYSDGRYAWVFDSIVKLKEPIPHKGALGLWPLDSTVKQELLMLI